MSGGTVVEGVGTAVSAPSTVGGDAPQTEPPQTEPPRTEASQT